MVRRIAGVVLLLAGVLRAQTTWPTTPDTTSTLLFDKNLFGTVLTAPVSSSATTMTVQSTAGLATNMEVLVDFEAVKITNIASLTLTVQRGFDSSVPAPHGLLAKVYRLPGAAYHNFLASAIFAMQITPFNVVLSVPSGACSPNNKIVWVPGGSIYGCVAGNWLAISGGGGSAVWGAISGVLANQSDLQSALNAKQNLLTLPLSVANGGTGTPTPSLVQGANITITGSWPNQTINSSAGGGAVWGAITGTLSAQTDLQTALNAKQATGNYLIGLTGDVVATGPGSVAAVLATVNANVGACGDATHVPQVTLDAKGRATGCTPVVITGSNGITALTGDVTATGPGSAAATLAAVGSAGSCGDSTHSCQLTFDTKGRETARANVAISGGGGPASAIVSGLLASLPVTCAAGDVYFATNQPAGQQLYQCSATNTWTQTFLNDSTITLTAGAFGVDLNQFCRFTNSCTVAARWDFSGAASTSPNKKGLASAIPATCTVGDTYFETDATAGQNLYGCTATNTWTLQGGGGSVTPHWVAATNSGTQTIPGSFTQTDMLWNTNDASTTNPSLHDPVSNTQNFVADATGYWHGVCEVSTGTVTTDIGVLISVNGTPIWNGGGPGIVSTGSGVWQINVPWSAHLTSGDIVKCVALSNVGFASTAGAGTKFYMELQH